ncbi:MAG: hypothetical protein OEZ43_13180 [Gammaproteobacteria bacterium]|nr:hypothetical protein [Gammaproteobacteria bacterium]
MNYEILQDMEAFTQTMFNRIIGFQEKDHPAWDESLKFEQRIKNLPLHYLIFSNGDRDPQTHGPTVNHYYPLQWEMATLAAYTRAVSPVPIMLDVHARNGFTGSLLARENIRVIGYRDPGAKPNQIENFFDEEQYELRNGTIADVDFPVDVVFSNWMPSGNDITDDILRLRPKLVIYIYTQHKDEDNAQTQTGVEGAFGERLSENYRLVDEWTVTRQRDLLKEIWPDLTGSIEENRIVRVYADRPWHQLKLRAEVDPSKQYSWEYELLMTETAYQAKQEMRTRGFPVGQF